jgi:hypothetical protein
VTLLHEFKREERLPSYFANRLQDFLSGARTDLRLAFKSNTEVVVTPAEPYGIAAIDLQGLWRFRTTPVSRAHPGGEEGTYVIWAVGTKQKVSEVPKSFTDETDYKFDLRITDGSEPEGAGVEVFEEIGEIDWDGAKIIALRQTYNVVTGAMIQDGALSSEAASDVEWTRAANGGLLANLKANSVTATEIMNGTVAAAEIANALKPSAGAAAGTEALRALGTTASTAAAGNDSRLSDERTPKDNSVTATKVHTSLKPSGEAAAGTEALRAIGATASTAAAGNDARLSDERTPKAESVTAAKVANALKPSAGAAAGTEALRALGATASTACAGNDARLSDERTPKANSVNSAKIENGTVTDADLASPNNELFRELLCGTFIVPPGTVNGNWLVTPTGVLLKESEEVTAVVPHAVHYNPGQIPMAPPAGKTARMYLHVTLITNNVALTGINIGCLMESMQVKAQAGGGWKFSLLETYGTQEFNSQAKEANASKGSNWTAPVAAENFLFCLLFSLGGVIPAGARPVVNYSFGTYYA